MLLKSSLHVPVVMFNETVIFLSCQLYYLCLGSLSGARDAWGVTQPDAGDWWRAGKGGHRSVHPHPRYTASADSGQHTQLPTHYHTTGDYCVCCLCAWHSLSVMCSVMLKHNNIVFMFVIVCFLQLELWDVDGSRSRQHSGPANHGDDYREAECYGSLCR